MKLHQLRDVIAVVEAGGLRAAARSLGLSQSSITKSVQMLEKELGAPIFVREAHGATLTALGQLFVQRARVAVGEINRAKEEIHQHLGVGTGRVVACLSTVPHMALLPEVLPQFLARYPGVELSIVEGLGLQGVEAQLRDGDIDFYIGAAPTLTVPQGFALEELFVNDRIIVCRKGHALASARSLSALVDARWSMTGQAFAQGPFAALFEAHALPTPKRITFGGNILGQMVMVLYCDMLAIVPRQWMQFGPLVGMIEPIEVAEPLPAPSMVLVRRASLPLTPAAEFFCDLVRRAAGRIGVGVGSI